MSLSTKIHAALKEMELHLHKSDWRGKENDCVNLFAHRFLTKRVQPIDRIGIEVAVPQLGGKGRKQAVRKDLVVWKRSGDTAWGVDWKAKAVPEAILEWKVKRGPFARPTISSRDRKWLKAFKRKHRGFIGVCVTIAYAKNRDIKWEFV